MNDDTRGAIEADLRRVADRLRGAPLPRVEAALPRARALLQRLADVAADTDGSPRRTVPELPVNALGDQFAVLGRDLITAIDGREGDAGALEQVADDLRALRLAL